MLLGVAGICHGLSMAQVMLLKRFVLGRTLQRLGAQIGDPDQCVFNGLKVDLWPRISWSPLFALTLAQLKVLPVSCFC